MSSSLQRTFFPGDHWLFFKIYTGQKTSDMLLAERIGPLALELQESGLIDHWFFIRYSDPKHHLRVRFYCGDKSQIGKVMNLFLSKVQDLTDQGFIWNIQLDTYQRELERYGPTTMELSEKLFYHDSQMVVNFLKLIEGEEGEKLRWLFALKAMDSFLNTFDYEDERKLSLMEILKTNFGKEFGMSRPLKKQLDEKYRNYKKEIEAFVAMDGHWAQNYNPLLNLLKFKENNISQTAKTLLRYQDGQNLQVNINNFMASHIHMIMNRLFPSKNRLHELVCYDFFYRYLRSKIARNLKRKAGNLKGLPKAINQ